MSQQCTGCCNNESCCLNVGCAQAVDLGWLFNRTALKQNDWPLLWVSIADNSKHWVLSAHHWTNSAYASSWVSRGVVVHENLLTVWLEIPQKFLGACVSASSLPGAFGVTPSMCLTDATACSSVQTVISFSDTQIYKYLSVPLLALMMLLHTPSWTSSLFKQSSSVAEI